MKLTREQLAWRVYVSCFIVYTVIVFLWLVTR